MPPSVGMHLGRIKAKDQLRFLPLSEGWPLTPEPILNPRKRAVEESLLNQWDSFSIADGNGKRQKK
jgi:hypothetical protein